MHRFLRSLSFCLVLCALSFADITMAAPPDRIDVLQVNIEPREEGWTVNAEFDFELKPRLQEAVEHGLPLYFVVDFELTRPRWYWFDEKALQTSLTYRLSYHALTREYRLSTGGSLQQGFSSLAEAVGVITHVRNWRVAERGALKPGETYLAAIRMRLDTTQLPKPFQITAITSREWTLDSDWRRFTVEPPK